jgi:8-oxo-dGTP diphosphatase
MEHQRFNIRVYGILEHEGSVLVSHERIADRAYAKFPGGGLEFGEGPMEAVIREFMEELGVEAHVTGHFYTTDFYLPSAFDPKDQIVSIYYRMALNDEAQLPLFPLTANVLPTSAEVLAAGQLFRWYPIAALTDALLPLPADRVVASMLRDSKM